MAHLATEQINLRITAETKKVLEQAANLFGISVSDFCQLHQLTRLNKQIINNLPQIIYINKLEW